MLLVSLGAFLTVTLFALALAQALSARRARLRERLEMLSYGDYTAAADHQSRGLLRMQNYSSLPLLQRLLQRSPRAERIADDLSRAGIPLRVGEYLSISVAVGLSLALGARLVLPGGLVSGMAMLLGFLAGMYLPRWYVKRRIRRRRGQIEKLLPDALDIIARGLRTGNGLLASIDSVVEQMGGPVGEELGRMRRETAAGLGLEEAFRELDRRVASNDLHIVVTAILIQREVGGSLSEILGNVSETMRERVELRNEVRALTSQQRFSTYIVAAVPPFILLVMFVLQRDMITAMFEYTLGYVVLAVAALLELTGVMILRWLTSSFEV